MLSLKHGDLNKIGNDYMLGNKSQHIFIYTERGLLSTGFRFNNAGGTIGIDKSQLFGNYHR